MVLCKGGTVAGTFTFNVLPTGTIATDVVQSTTNLSAGSCDTVLTRVEVGPVAATLVITESIAANASTFLQNVTVNGVVTATVGSGVTVTTNYPAPTKTVVFVNAQATVGATVAYNTNPTPGVVVVCKSHDSPRGTFNFTINAIGTVATDQVVSNITLTAGTCKTVFIRTVPQLVSASLTVTETINAGSLFVLDRIIKTTSSGKVVITGALGLVVTENATSNGGSVIVFVNKKIRL